MRAFAVLALALLFAGCASTSDGSDSSTSPTPDRIGVVIHNEPFTVTSAQPATFTVSVEEHARNMQLEVRQDSGVLPNLRVDLSGCGGADPPASGGWSKVSLCDAPAAGSQTLTVSIRSGAPSGSGQALLRADLVSHPG